MHCDDAYLSRPSLVSLFLSRLFLVSLCFSLISLSLFFLQVVFFLAHPSLVKSPHLRASLGDVLYKAFLPRSERANDDPYGKNTTAIYDRTRHGFCKLVFETYAQQLLLCVTCCFVLIYNTKCTICCDPHCAGGCWMKQLLWNDFSSTSLYCNEFQCCWV